MGGLKGCWFHTALSSLSKMFLQSEHDLSFMFSYVLGGGEHYVNNIYFVKENFKRDSCSLIVNAGGDFFSF